MRQARARAATRETPILHFAVCCCLFNCLFYYSDGHSSTHCATHLFSIFDGPLNSHNRNLDALMPIAHAPSFNDRSERKPPNHFFFHLMNFFFCSKIFRCVRAQKLIIEIVCPLNFHVYKVKMTRPHDDFHAKLDTK